MLKKISVDNLELGMHLHAFCGSWLEHPFWRTRFVIKNGKDLALIRASSIREVWINTALGADVPASLGASVLEVKEEAAESAPAVDKQPARSEFGEEVQRAAKICSKAKEAVVSMFQEARMGNAVDAEQAQELVEEIAGSVMRNPGALISLARLKTADDYTYMHSVAVCALMIALARVLNLTDKEMRQAGMAGLMHDLGKAMMPPEVLNKPGQLTNEEFAIMKTHPEEGFKLLLEGSGVTEVMKDVCLHHHEKVDGSGYPKGLKGAEISLFSRMGAVCDVYDAVTSNRPYKAAWDPAEAIKRMAEWQGHFDSTVFQAFVKSLGIYPIGSCVRLQSGRLAVVIEQTEKSLLQPRVKVFFSTKSQTYIPPEVIDLSRPGTLEKIAGREDATKWGIQDLTRFWVSGAAQSA